MTTVADLLTSLQSPWTAREAVQRLQEGGRLKRLDLSRQGGDELVELVDCLVSRPNALTHLDLVRCQMTDELGVRLAGMVGSSTTIRRLSLAYNHLGESTYLAVAAALRTNSSLRKLYLHNNQTASSERIEEAFVQALRMQRRPYESKWWLFTRSNVLPELQWRAFPRVANQATVIRSSARQIDELEAQLRQEVETSQRLAVELDIARTHIGQLQQELAAERAERDRLGLLLAQHQPELDANLTADSSF